MIKEFKREPLGQDASVIEIHSEETKNESNVDMREVENIFTSPKKIEDIIEKSKTDATLLSNKTYIEVFKKVIAENQKQISLLEESIVEEKNKIYKKVSKQDPVSVDISDSNALKTHYVEVFGKRSKSISFEDYVALLELKKLLEVDEQKGILGVAEI